MSAELIPFPSENIINRRRAKAGISQALKKAQAESVASQWKEVLVVGRDGDGEFQISCSDMTAERALWLVRWAEHWAMGLHQV